MPKSWNEKYHNGKPAIVKQVDKKFADIVPGEKMLIATPSIINEYVNNTPNGSHSTLKVMREDLALDYSADKTCPVTSSIFLRIVAEKAYEEYTNGKPINEITPFWRLIGPKDPIASKLSFGMEFILDQRKKEGLPL